VSGTNQTATNPERGRSGTDPFPGTIIITALILIVVLLFLLIIVVTIFKVPSELGLPVLAIFGVVALLISLSFAALCFNRVGMSDKTEALALPQGSVRAVIALSLVVLFAILTVYLFTSLSSNRAPGQPKWCLDESARNNLLQSLHRGELIVTDRPMTPEETVEHCKAGQPTAQSGPRDQSSSSAGQPAPATTQSSTNPSNPAGPTSGPTATPTAAQPAPPGQASTPGGQPTVNRGPSELPATAPAPKFVVTLQETADPTAQDFAKQLLVLIGTLVTAVASFYFGSKAVADAHEAVIGINLPPSLTGIDPTTLEPGPNRPLNILGNNLNSVKQAQLNLQGSQPISAFSVTSNDNRVSAALSIPSGTPSGPWDVIVSDGQGRSDRLSGVLTIGASQADAGVQSDGLPSSPAGLPSTVPVRLGIDDVANLQNLKLEVDGHAVSVDENGFVELALETDIAHTIRATAQRAGNQVEGELTLTPSLKDMNAAFELALR
jgi:hypothetical protein